MSDTSYNSSTVNNMAMDDEIDLKELFMVLWSGKWLISAITGVAAASVAVALMLPNVYAAILRRRQTIGRWNSALMQQYGGLASLAGVSPVAGRVARATRNAAYEIACIYW